MLQTIPSSLADSWEASSAEGTSSKAGGSNLGDINRQLENHILQAAHSHLPVAAGSYMLFLNHTEYLLDNVIKSGFRLGPGALSFKSGFSLCFSTLAHGATMKCTELCLLPAVMKKSSLKAHPLQQLPSLVDLAILTISGLQIHPQINCSPARPSDRVFNATVLGGNVLT